MRSVKSFQPAPNEACFSSSWTANHFFVSMRKKIVVTAIISLMYTFLNVKRLSSLSLVFLLYCK